MEEKEIHDELATIRGLMERSSKFISLSGLSGILAGVYALIGAAWAYYVLYWNTVPEFNPYVTQGNPSPANGGKPAIVTGLFYGGDTGIFDSITRLLLLIAVIVLLASVCTGIILSIRKAKRKGQQMWGKTSRSLLFNMAVPLFSGGALIMVFLFRGHYGIVAPAMLIFYGISLVNASNFTFNDIKYLGLSEIFLGIFAACLPGYGLLFWAIGFGVLHIIYGSMMYLKYDR
jgi:hypothetical protein